MAVQDRETDRQRKRGRVGWNKGGVNVVKLVLSGAVWPDGEIKSIIPNMEKWKISNDFFSRIAIFTIAQKLPYIFLPSIFVAEIYLAQSGYTVSGVQNVPVSVKLVHFMCLVYINAIQIKFWIFRYLVTATDFWHEWCHWHGYGLTKALWITSTGYACLFYM